MQLIQFKANEIEKIWPLVKDHVQSALDRNQNFRDHSDVKENCINGLEQLWVIVDKKDNVHGVCITQIVKQKNYNIYKKKEQMNSLPSSSRVVLKI